MKNESQNGGLALDYLFNPRSIAIVGVSSDLTKFNFGRMFVEILIDRDFKGKIYPIHPKGGEIFGLRIHPSVKDIPDRVDYVISAVPAQYARQLIEDCSIRGVRAVNFFAAGFSEIEDDEGKRLESEIVAIARRAGIRIIGPNCMGFYCPSKGLSYGQHFPKKSGTLGLVSQSGGLTSCCIWEAATRGIYFSKVISYGNSADLNETDFLEYLAHDPETKVIAAYIEGTKDGPRFISMLKEATKRKPVVIYKAGTTESGTRAALSHTAAIAGSNIIWEGLLRQAGAIQVHSIEELVDLALLFIRVPPPKGKNTVVIGGGGGPSVKATDDCANAGLIVPALPREARERLTRIFGSEAGRMFRNPVDIAAVGGKKMIMDTIEAVAKCDEVDLLVMQIAFDIYIRDKEARKSAPAAFVDSVIEVQGSINKPLVVALHYHATDEAMELASEARLRLGEAGVPVYPSVPRAASALNKFIQHHQWLSKTRKDNG
ncbi:MAG: CoA-binding protein [Pseudomonadota bacterium]